MKSIVFGIMIASVSVSFAQTDEAPTHQLKNRFTAKQKMVVQPVSMDVKENTQKVALEPRSRMDVRSSRVSGVIVVDRGIPFVLLKSDRFERYMMPVNLPKRMAVSGQEIEFNYTVSEVRVPKNSRSSMAINMYDISTSPRK